MNTRLGKSFGLAFVVAVGILAVMFALGTFNAQNVGAQDVDDTIEIEPATPAPGAEVEVELTVDFNETVGSYGDVVIELEGFSIPGTIDPRDVLIRGSIASPATVTGNPSNVDVDDNVITLEIEGVAGGDDTYIAAEDNVIIVIRKRAGITAPALADTYDVTVGGQTNEDAVTVSSTLGLDPGEGSSSTEITVSGMAFADGSGALYSRAVTGAGIDTNFGTEDDLVSTDREKLADITISDGAFEVVVDAEDLEKGTIGNEGYSRLEVRDAEGASTEYAFFQVTGTMTLGADSVGKGELLKISLSDWIDLNPDSVTIDGVVVADNAAGDPAFREEDGTTLDPSASPPEVPTVDLTDGTLDIYVKVEGDIGLGTKTVVLLDSSVERLSSASVEITALALSVSPSTAVAGQEITVEGSGFSTAEDNQLATLMVGDKEQTILSNRRNVDDYNVLTGGGIVITFAVPDEVTDGSQTIQVTDDEGRVGEVELTVPEPTIELDPASSRRATNVAVDGSGFPADSNIIVDFGDDKGVASDRTDDTGNFTASFPIPSDAKIGGEVTVTASIEVGATKYSVDATHTVPAKEITVSPDVVSSGEMITITGTGFPRYSDVEVQFGDGNPKTTDASTDNIGDFTVSVVVPGMDPGTHVIQVTAGDESNTWVLTVPDAPIIRTWPSADAFASLITAGNLTVVWNFDNATKAWSFYDPRPAVAGAVDLNEVSSGNNVWIRVTADQMFQGDMLTAGWNLVTLD